MAGLECVMKDIPFGKLVINPHNLRFRAGQVEEGIKVVDTYNLSKLKEDLIVDPVTVIGRIIVEEMPDGTFVVLSGNRRTSAVQELQASGTLTVELAKQLKALPCSVYKNLTEARRRNLINDQRSQKYFRSEMDRYCWKLQNAGMTFPEIAEFVWEQYATYAAGGARKTIDIQNCATAAERKKEITKWLKGQIDNVVLKCGKLGPRVRRAQLLSNMAIDGISPPLLDAEGKPILDEKGVPKVEVAEFKPNQQRCNELYKAQQDDPNWTMEKGGEQFNALIARYSREDRGINPDGSKIVPGPTRASADMLDEQLATRTQSNAIRVALRWARGEKPPEMGDVDAAAYRVEQMFTVIAANKDKVKNPTVKALLDIFVAGDKLALESFLAKHS